MTDKPLVYVSGPMTGLPDHNYNTFDRAASRLRSLGYEVINPAETAGGTIHLPRETFLRIDVGYVMAAEAVALLPGWSDSKGSKLEVMVAEAMGLPIYFYNEREGLGAELRVEGVEVRGSIRGDRTTRHGETEMGDAAAWVQDVTGEYEYWEDVKGQGFVCEHDDWCRSDAIAMDPSIDTEHTYADFNACFLCAHHANEAGIRIRPNVGKGCGA